MIQTVAEQERLRNTAFKDALEALDTHRGVWKTSEEQRQGLHEVCTRRRLEKFASRTASTKIQHTATTLNDMLHNILRPGRGIRAGLAEGEDRGPRIQTLFRMGSVMLEPEFLDKIGYEPKIRAAAEASSPPSEAPVRERTNRGVEQKQPSEDEAQEKLGLQRNKRTETIKENIQALNTRGQPSPKVVLTPGTANSRTAPSRKRASSNENAGVATWRANDSLEPASKRLHEAESDGRPLGDGHGRRSHSCSYQTHGDDGQNLPAIAVSQQDGGVDIGNPTSNRGISISEPSDESAISELTSSPQSMDVPAMTTQHHPQLVEAIAIAARDSFSTVPQPSASRLSRSELRTGVSPQSIETEMHNRLFARIRDGIAFYCADRGYSQTAAAEFAENPNESLESLYVQFLGTETWRAKLLELDNDKPFPLNATDALLGIIAHKFRETFDPELWSTAMEERGYSFDEYIKHVASKQIQDPEFRERSVKPHAEKLAHRLALSLRPHFQRLKSVKEPKERLDRAWVENLEHAYASAIILKQRIEAADNATYEYVWFHGDEAFNLETMQSHYSGERAGSVVATLLPGIKATYKGSLHRPSFERFAYRAKVLVAAFENDIKRDGGTVVGNDGAHGLQV